jgi:hypothetical protein
MFGTIPARYPVLLGVAVIVMAPGRYTIGTIISLSLVMVSMVIVVSTVNYAVVSWVNDRGLFLLAEVFVCVWCLSLYRAYYPLRSGDSYALGLVRNTKKSVLFSFLEGFSRIAN